MSENINSRFCKGCRRTKEKIDFLSENNEIKASCKDCRKRTKVSKRQKREQITTEARKETLISYKENAILLEQLSSIIYQHLLEKDGIEDPLEDNNIQFTIEQTLSLDSLIEDSPTIFNEEIYQKLASQIVTIASEGDGYKYVYHTKEIKQGTISFFYWCNMRIELNKHSKKHEDTSKQRDTDPRISRHQCGGFIMIKIDYENGLIFFKLNHTLHSRPNQIGVTDSIKQYINTNIKLNVSEIYREIKEQKLPGYELLTRGQVYYWWNRQAVLEYRRNNDEYISVQLFLKEKNYSIIFETIEPIKSLAFITPFLSQFSYDTFKTIVTDATYNTNTSKYELYGVMGIIDGTAFPLSYILVASGKNRPMTKILAGWFAALKAHGMNNIKNFLTDKDMAQINAALLVWPNVCIQLCLWHMKRAVEQHLSSKKQAAQIRYNAQEAHKQCSVIDPNWQPIVFRSVNYSSNANSTEVKQIKSKNSSQILCLKHHRDAIIQRMEQHFHRHMLIPTSDKEFITDPREIWIRCVREMFQFCHSNNLEMVWAYLWENWYSWTQFILWARCSSSDIIIHKTTMFIESHWRILKHDHLHKFSQPRLDLLCYVIVSKVVPQQYYRYHLLYCNRELPSWRKEFKTEWRKLTSKSIQNWDKYITDKQKWVCSCPYFLTNQFFLCKHLVVPMGKMENTFFKMVRRNENYPLLSKSNVTIWQELGYKQNSNETPTNLNNSLPAHAL